MLDAIGYLEFVASGKALIYDSGFKTTNPVGQYGWIPLNPK